MLAAEVSAAEWWEAGSAMSCTAVPAMGPTAHNYSLAPSHLTSRPCSCHPLLQPIAVTQLPGPGADSGRSVPRNPPTAAPTGGSRAAPAQRPPAPPAHVNPDLGTSAPILPLLARMLQQQQQ